MPAPTSMIIVLNYATSGMLIVLCIFHKVVVPFLVLHTLSTTVPDWLITVSQSDTPHFIINSDFTKDNRIDRLSIINICCERFVIVPNISLFFKKIQK